MFRSIPLPRDLLDLLQAWFESGRAPGDRLWPWSRMTGYRRVREVMRDAGLTESYATPKGLRHGFAVRAIQSGVTLNLVQRWLGHADIKTTAIYTNAIGPEEREIAARMWNAPREAPQTTPPRRKRAVAPDRRAETIIVPQSVALDLDTLDPAVIQWLKANLEGEQKVGRPKGILLYCAL